MTAALATVVLVTASVTRHNCETGVRHWTARK